MLDPRHSIADALDDVLTPALAIYPEIVRDNVARMRTLLGGAMERWRPHLKTAKVDRVVRLLFEAGLSRAKCATTLEAARALAVWDDFAAESGPAAAAAAGGLDLLIAFPHRGANLRRIAALARAHPRARLSVLVEDEAHLAEVRALGAGLGAFVDVNPGMDRTGVALERAPALLAIARAAQAAGLLRGIHPYEGHLHEGTPAQRRARSHEGYDRLLALLAAAPDLRVEEICTSGTPTFLHALAHEGLARGPWRHTVSPGTIVYWDLRSEEDLPEIRFTPAALVLARVVSAPRPGRVTADAGHKQISADAGDPVAACLSHAGLAARHPSEEHLPLELAPGALAPRPGEVLYLLPRHVCPTVNNADECLIVERNRIVAIEPVAARGHEVGVLRKNVSRG
jgi:D-serine deaminase-like pyridoxal phosphate-dependent protein